MYINLLQYSNIASGLSFDQAIRALTAAEQTAGKLFYFSVHNMGEDKYSLQSLPREIADGYGENQPIIYIT